MTSLLHSLLHPFTSGFFASSWGPASVSQRHGEVTSSSPLAVSARPPLRSPSIPKDHLPHLISFGILVNYLYPALLDVPGVELPHPPTLPPWEQWLESWYLM